MPGVPWSGWALKLTGYTKNRGIFRSPFMPQTANWWTGPSAASPSDAIYIWKSRSQWACPFNPDDTGGFPEDPVAEARATGQYTKPQS
jgi:hypothetical protein